jgi:hypothetical protein
MQHEKLQGGEPAPKREIDPASVISYEFHFSLCYEMNYLPSLLHLTLAPVIYLFGPWGVMQKIESSRSHGMQSKSFAKSSLLSPRGKTFYFMIFQKRRGRSNSLGN